MDKEPNAFEQSAQIVEAFIAGQPADVVELLTTIVAAIRAKAIDD